MSKKSAGILAYRKLKELEVLLVHPGGPFFKAKDEGVWSIPKGEYTNENALNVAKREFNEETGNTIETDNFVHLSNVKLKSGKQISAWAVECDFETSFISSNMFDIEWPPKSGKTASFPEVDKAEWFTIDIALKKIHPAQVNFIKELVTILHDK